MAETVFDRLTDALTNGMGVSLSHAEIELLLSVLGDEFGKAESAYEHWRDIFDEYERNAQREHKGPDSES